MKLAVLNSDGIKTTLEDKKRYYKIVSNDYDFEGNFSTDVTDLKLMEHFYKLNRFNSLEDFIDSLKTKYTSDGFNSLSTDDKELVSRYFVSNKTERDTIKSSDEQLVDAEELSKETYNNASITSSIIDSDGDITSVINNTTTPKGINYGKIISTGIINDTLISDVDNWTPNGIDMCNIILASTNKNIDISGVVGQEQGRKILLVNDSNKKLKLLNNSSLSFSGNRFRIEKDYTLKKYSTITLIYIGDYWRLTGG